MSNQSRGRAGGVLPVNATARKNPAANSAAKTSARAPAPRLRLIIRRLPPGLTETEFWTALGQAWKVGAGKVEWAAFKDGKVSKDPAKPSRPSRAYIKVKEQSFLDELSATVKASAFQDARNTTKDSCLLGPPSLELSPYAKTPNGRPRNDNRQGTIDQDQEFIDFLHSLTEPINKTPANGADTAEGKPEKVSTTPLVQYIKEKKANKAKEALQAKTTKTREAKEVKNPKETRSTVIIKGKNTSAAEKERVAKAVQDTVKAIHKSVAHTQETRTPTKPEPKELPKETPSSSKAIKRERGNVSAAARMLQRDLGLVAKENKLTRPPKASTTTVETPPAAKPGPVTSKSTTQANAEKKEMVPSTPTPPAPPTGPRGSRTPSTASTKAAPPMPPQRAAKASPQPSVGAKSAFLKHANPSQGITEELLQTIFKEFGPIARCEIDKKKGLGYVDFTETESLKKAMQASPVKVGNGQVVVLENRPQYGNKRGAGPPTRGQTQLPANPKSAAPIAAASSTLHTNMPATVSPAPATASRAPATVRPEQTQTTPTTTQASTVTPPTASTAPTAPRGGGSGGRGGGVTTGGPRGGGRNPSQGSRGRGGRGTQGRRGGAAAAASVNAPTVSKVNTTVAPSAEVKKE